MNRKLRFTLFSALALLLLTTAYYFLNSNSDEEKIRKSLVSLASLAVKPSEASPAELAVKLRTIQTIFTGEIIIDFGARKLSGKYTPRSLEPMMVNFRKHFANSKCSAGNIEITVAGERADAVFSCSFKGTTIKGDVIDEVKDVNCRLVKYEKKWYIESISINDILER